MAHGQGATSNRSGGYGPLSRGSRGHGKDNSVKKKEKRARDPRYQEAMEETRRAREELDALIAEQQANPAMGATPGAIHARTQREIAVERAQIIEDEYARAELVEDAAAVAHDAGIHHQVRNDQARARVKRTQTVTVEKVYYYEIHRVDTSELPQEGDGKWKFSYQTAVIMLKAGYNIKKVIEYTGIGFKDLEHIPVDEEGYVIVEEEDADTGSQDA